MVDAISAISSRSPSESDRVFRLCKVATKLVSLALTAGSACGAPERLRVSGFGCKALTIWFAETLLSPAIARLAVIDSTAVSVIAAVTVSL